MAATFVTLTSIILYYFYQYKTLSLQRYLEGPSFYHKYDFDIESYYVFSNFYKVKSRPRFSLHFLLASSFLLRVTFGHIKARADLLWTALGWSFGLLILKHPLCARACPARHRPAHKSFMWTTSIEDTMHYSARLRYGIDSGMQTRQIYCICRRGCYIKGSVMLVLMWHHNVLINPEFKPEANAIRNSVVETVVIMKHFSSDVYW